MSRYLFRLVPVLCLLLALVPDIVEAIPAFARRYELPCHFCHDGFPKLSVLGEQFKERGFRLDNDKSDVGTWIRSVPVSVRGAFRQTFEEKGDADSSALVRLVTAGDLGSRVSYWLEDNYVLDSEDSRRVGLDNAFVRVEVLPDELYVRGGRIELDLPFTQTRTPQLFRYEIYFANTGFESDNIGVHQDGVEVGGFLDDTTRWSIAVVDGYDSEEQKAISEDAGQFEGNVFGRLVRRFGEGRAGTYIYWGGNTLTRKSGDDVLEWKNGLLRLGADASVYLGQAHVYGTFSYGRNSNSFADAENPNGTGEALSFTGGFLQVDFALRDDFFVTGRLNTVRGPPSGTTDPSKSFVQFAPGLRLWLHPQIRLVGEIAFANQDLPTKAAFRFEIAY